MYQLEIMFYVSFFLLFSRCRWVIKDPPIAYIFKAERRKGGTTDMSSSQL